MSYFRDVEEFHRKFGLPVTWDPARHGTPDLEAVDFVLTPRFPSPKVLLYRGGFLEEEVREFWDAANRRDLVQVADALADLVYVAVGTAHFLGVPFDEVWREVHRANLAKERGDGHRRGPAEKIVKPAGWRAPDVRRHLERAGWREEKTSHQKPMYTLDEAV